MFGVVGGIDIGFEIFVSNKTIAMQMTYPHEASPTKTRYFQYINSNWLGGDKTILATWAINNEGDLFEKINNKT